MADAVRVLGLRDLERAFTKADRYLAGDLRDVLEEAASPVRRDAQTLAGATIRNLHAGDEWSRMRTGVSRSIAYVAPVPRGVKGRDNRRRRRNLADLLMGRAMQPALERNRLAVERRFELLLDEVVDVWERA